MRVGFVQSAPQDKLDMVKAVVLDNPGRFQAVQEHFPAVIVRIPAPPVRKIVRQYHTGTGQRVPWLWTAA